MTLDDTARAVAERLIGRFGKRVTIRRVTRGFDPATGKTTETTRDFTAKVSPPERFREHLIDGTLIKAGDLQAQLATKSAPIVPEPARDRIIIDGESYQVLRADPVMGGEAAAFYILHLRT